MSRHYSAPRNSPSHGLIWILGLALLICIAVIAWQAGRLSAIEERSPEPTANTGAEGAGSDSGDSAEKGSARKVSSIQRSSRDRNAQTQDRSLDSQRTRSNRNGTEPNERSGNPSGKSETAQVRKYFSQMDVAAASGSNVMDPNELAQSVLGQALSGDLSGFDGITVGQREVLRQMKAIVPPTACAEHHRLSIHTMEKAIDVMEAMSSSLQTQDLTQMLMLSTRAQSLMDDAEKVDALGKELSDQYGL